MGENPPSAKDAKAFIALFDKFQSEDAKEALAYLLMAFSRLNGCYCEPHSHGYMSSLRIIDGTDWCFAFSPARNWVLAYIRPPGLQKNRILVADLQMELPHAEDRGDDHLTVRIGDADQAQVFYRFIARSRNFAM